MTISTLQLSGYGTAEACAGVDIFATGAALINTRCRMVMIEAGCERELEVKEQGGAVGQQPPPRTAHFDEGIEQGTKLIWVHARRAREAQATPLLCDPESHQRVLTWRGSVTGKFS
eukprot:1159144-Pelagomonas_calceolata.AAC.9